MRVLKLMGRLVAMGVVAMVSGTAFAQSYYVGDQVVPVSEAKLSELSQRLEALETSMTLMGKDGKDGKDGWEDVSTEGWSHKWGGRIMGDYVNFANQNADSIGEAGDAQDYFEMRRMRLFVEGEGYGIYDYKLQVDFEPEFNGNDGVSMKDAYFGIHELPYLGYARFGNYKAPFSLEELTSSKYITFIERSLPNVFAPARRVGATAYDHTASQNITWAYGIFFQDIDQVLMERQDDNQGTILAGRVTWLPYYDEPSKGRYLLHTGLAYQYVDDADDSVRFRPRPEVHEGPRWMDTGALAADDYNVVGAEGAIVWGPLSLQSEFMYVPVDDVGGVDYDFYGAYVYGSWFLTGENRVYSRSSGAFSRVKPYTNFWAVRCAGIGPGAVELGIRYSFLDLSGTGDEEAGMMNDLTLGVNWYWNPHIRWMFNYIHNWNKYDNNPNAPGGLAENDILAIRGQVDF